MNKNIISTRFINNHLKIAYILSTILYIVLFVYFLNWITSDMMDYMDWVNQIAVNGREAIKAYPFGYSPASMLIFSASLLLPFPGYVSIKLLALPVVLISALITSDLTFKLSGQKTAAWLAYTLTCLLPTILVNTALWGQTDIYYSLVMLLTVYFFLHHKPYAALAAWGIAISLKAPPLFLGPFLLFLFIKKQIPWKAILIPPMIYILCAIPFLLLGAPPEKTLGIYFSQTGSFHSLCMNCASIWSFFPSIDYQTGLISGILLTLAGVLGYLWIMLKKIDPADPSKIVLAALLSAILMPFLLPKMHERYFFFAELLSVCLIFLDWRFLLAAVLLQISTGSAYWHYLMHNASVLSTGISTTINLLVIGLLFWALFKPASKPSPLPEGQA